MFGGGYVSQASELQMRQWVDGSVERLLSAGYRGQHPDDERFVAGVRRADFQVKWALTRLHTFVLFGCVEHATADGIREFTALSHRWATQAKGGLPRGFQAGVAVLPVLVCISADEGAMSEVMRRPDKHFAAADFPLLVQLGQGRYATYSGGITWGEIYQDFLRSQQELIVGDLPGQALPPISQQKRTFFAVLSITMLVGFVVATLGAAGSLLILLT